MTDSTAPATNTPGSAVFAIFIAAAECFFASVALFPIILSRHVVLIPSSPWGPFLRGAYIFCLPIWILASVNFLRRRNWARLVLFGLNVVFACVLLATAISTWEEGSSTIAIVAAGLACFVAIFVFGSAGARQHCGPPRESAAPATPPARTSLVPVIYAVLLAILELLILGLTLLTGLAMAIVEDEAKARSISLIFAGCAGILLLATICFFFRKNWARTLLAGLNILLTLLWLFLAVVGLVKKDMPATLVLLVLCAVSIAGAFAFVSVSVREFCGWRRRAPEDRASPSEMS